MTGKHEPTRTPSGAITAGQKGRGGAGECQARTKRGGKEEKTGAEGGKEGSRKSQKCVRKEVGERGSETRKRRGKKRGASIKAEVERKSEGKEKKGGEVQR